MAPGTPKAVLAEPGSRSTTLASNAGGNFRPARSAIGA
jgi:hypothetical protein